MRAKPLIAILAAFALPATVVGAIALDQASGAIAGTGITPTHDFPVKATSFGIEISDADTEGYRAIEVRVPVLAIDTDNEGRNKHMRNTIFDGFDAAGKDLVVFNARTDTPLEAGSVALDGRLSILGQGRPVTVTATISGTDPLRAQGSATIDLDDWGIKTPGFGPMKVKSEVTMGFDVALPAPASNADVADAE